jgi:outer membrane lipase/esterase
MAISSLRRAFVWLACASATLLTACGSSTVESQLSPSRIIASGDAFSVAKSGASYTVNDSAVNTWLAQFASSYGKTLDTSLVYAQGNARITATTDAAGSTSTATVTQQIDSFLAGSSLGSDDVVVVNGGISDLVVEMAAVNAGTETSDQMLANAKLYGQALGAQVRRLVTAGGKHVVVVGPYNLGVTPWATTLGQNNLLKNASSAFNEAMLVSIVDLGETVLYVDAAYYFNLVQATPTSYGLTNSTDLACTSVDSGAGIGTGTGQVNSSLCTTSTIAAITANSSGTTYDLYMFADRLYFTPAVQRLFGVYAYGKVHARW